MELLVAPAYSNSVVDLESKVLPDCCPFGLLLVRWGSAHFDKDPAEAKVCAAAVAVAQTVVRVLQEKELKRHCQVMAPRCMLQWKYSEVQAFGAALKELTQTLKPVTSTRVTAAQTAEMKPFPNAAQGSSTTRLECTAWPPKCYSKLLA